ncbi:hypothetical protein MTR67_001401 [Solanum verrucosum]|uniref:Uncharacterized protein n=1 Tax=Solanum verrucosum TaxID=315347 RepID=A0AAF0T7G6_SOLVR|nr:hypothetical protein MTR67_001401 [Solanum verrucosum]
MFVVVRVGTGQQKSVAY